jgi:transcriptional regulator with XRE-family HTH domain
MDESVDEHDTTARSSPASAEEIAHNLNALFDDYRRAHGRKLPNEEVADHVTRITGQKVHRTWIGKLRDGEVAAPDPARLDAVADFFGRTREYLLGIEDDVKILRELRETADLADQVEAKGISMRQLADLEPDDTDLVLNLLRNLARHQQRRSTPD